MSAVIEVVKKRNSSARGPFLASFEQNIPPQEEFESTLKVRIQEKNNKKTVLRISSQVLEIHGRGQRCSSKSNNEEGEQVDSYQPNAGSSYLIGLKDEFSDTIKVYPIEQLFKLQQQTTKELLEIDQVDSNIGKSKRSHLEQKQMLVAEFGTVKSRKKVKQIQANIVHEHNLSSQLKEQINGKGDELEDDALDFKSKEREAEIISKQQFLPQFDLDATNVNQIYNLQSIISQEDLINLDFAANLNSNKNSELFKSLTGYIKYIFNRFSENFGGRSNHQLISKQLVYLDYLLKISNKVKLSGNSLDDISKEINIPQQLLKNILKSFYQAAQIQQNIVYNRTQLLKDKLISYIIVLSLIIFDYQLEASQLASFLKLDPKKFLNYAKEVGCTVKISENKDSNHKLPYKISIQLKAPFKLIGPKKPSKKQK